MPALRINHVSRFSYTVSASNVLYSIHCIPTEVTPKRKPMHLKHNITYIIGYPFHNNNYNLMDIIVQMQQFFYHNVCDTNVRKYVLQDWSVHRKPFTRLQRVLK